MKFGFCFWLITTYIGAVSAFTPNLERISHDHLHPNNTPDSVTSIVRKIFSSEDLSNIRKHGMTLLAKKTPCPPDYIPRVVDEQLELDLMDSERRVMLYEKEVEMIREQLGLQQSELLDEQNSFRDEKNTLMGTIAEFSTILKKRDEELENAMEQAKQSDLENAIQSLESQLQEKTDSLEDEKKSSNELRKRFDDAEDALEFEQMNFEKERRLLQELVTTERKQVKALQEKFEENSNSFEVTREGLLDKIQKEEQQLSDTKTKWRVTQEQLRFIEEKLETSLQENALLLKESESDIDTEKADMSDEIVNLQDQIRKQQGRMEEIKSGLEKENKEFEDSKDYLEAKIGTEEQMIKDLQQELVEEQNKFEAHRSTLDQEIKNITANLENVETQLKNERANFSKEKEMLERKLANEICVGKLKKKEMKKRYDEIRREMTDLWESSKRQARQEENRLNKKYKRKLDTVQAQVAKLENDMTAEKKRLLVEQEKMRSRHAKELKSRDIIILELEGSVVTFNKLIADKDQIIKEKNERIQLYETSFRQLAKLGLVVTGNKIKKVVGPLKRLVQNSPPSDDIVN